MAFLYELIYYQQDLDSFLSSCLKVWLLLVISEIGMLFAVTVTQRCASVDSVSIII